MFCARNRRFYSLGQIFRSRSISKAVKIKIYETIMKPLMVFGSETWAKAGMDMKGQGTLERKIL
jgi:hypothetical protein